MKKGYKQTEVGVIPEEWITTRIGDVAKIKHGKSQKDVASESGAFPILGSGGEIGRTNMALYSQESVLIGRKGTINRPFYINTPFWTIDTLFYTEINDNKVFPKWLYNIFCNIKWMEYNEASGVPSLSANTISKIKLPLPTLPEQKKIAQILTSVDEIIETTRKVIEQTKKVKQGLLQELLTKGIGHTKFKKVKLGIDDVEVPESWKVKTFKEISKVRQGLQIPISSRFKETDKNRYIYITIQYLNDPSDKNSIYYIENPNNNVICKKEDILMTRTGNTGIVITNVKGVFHNNFFLVDYNREIIMQYYLYYFLNTKKVQELIKIYAGSTTIPDLNHGDFYRIPIFIPKISEQKQIVNIISSIDQKITKQESELNQLQTLKKGLMQDLLTGAVRVTFQ